MPDHDLYIFDVDGTLIEGYLRPDGKKWPYERVVVLPRRMAVIRRLCDQGARFALATNQGGVAMGYQEPGEVYEKIATVLGEVEFFYGQPLSVHVCMHHPAAKVAWWKEDPCPRRKPGPGMLQEAMAAHGFVGSHGGLNVTRSGAIFVGDSKTDEEAAKKAGIDFDYAEHFFNHGVRLYA